VSNVRLDNAGENKKLQKRAESCDWFAINWEFTARDTPQQNHLAELGFAVLANRGKALMHMAHIPKKTRYQIFPKAFKIATVLDGLVVDKGQTQTRFERFFGKNLKFVNHFRTFGEAGTVKVKKQQYPKLSDRGVTCMFVGYAVDHDGDCYEMLVINNGTIYVTRDVVWLKRMYFRQSPSEDEEEGIYLPIYLPTDVGVRESKRLATNDNDEEETVNTPDDKDDEDEDEKQTEGIEGDATATTRSGRSVKTPPYLNEYELGNIQHGFKLTKAEERFYSQMKEIGELALCATNLPVMKYKEAMDSPDKMKWGQGVESDHEKMTTYQVFEPVDVNEVPQDAKILTSTWVMRKKADGTYRARLTARGYEQIDGLHFDSTDTSAPVVNDTTIRIVFVLMIMAGWTAMLLDVRGAYMNGRFKDDEKLYMHVPEGFEKSFCY
jgi:hypothetical protein